MVSIRRFVRVGGAAALLLSGVGLSALDVSPAAGASGFSWGVTAPGISFGSFSGVACVSASDCWAVGQQPVAGMNQTATAYWNGSAWSAVTSPNTSAQVNDLSGVTCIDTSDCWAVGATESNSGGSEAALAEHWNGIGWSIVTTPSPTAAGNQLIAVACINASGCWAVGDEQTATGGVQTLVEHWDGSAWSIVTTPNTTSPTNVLDGVVCISASDCWAVGLSRNGLPEQNLAEHWNGGAWSIVTTPDTSPSQTNAFSGVSCSTTSDCWAVGEADTAADGLPQTLAEHWNGSAWSIVTTPNPSPSKDYLTAVDCISASNCWAVGYYGQTLAEHWDGTSWSIVTTPNTNPESNILSGVACPTSSDCWVVGNAETQTLIEHGTLSATPTSTTVSSSANPSSAATQPSDHQGAVVTAKVSPTSAQTMDGFGASGAWWPNDLQNFPGTVQKRVAELLFSRTGIALSSYRYNVGGGGVGVTDPTRAPQTFLTSPGVYNWSADAGGMRFLRLARDHGVPILVGFVNSAPRQWTTNGKNCGGQLIPGDEGAYAAYLAEVVHHLHVADGITLSYISPMNEPDNSFGSCGQEGMAVPVGQRATVVQDLGKALAKRAPYARVIADESSLAVFQFLPEVPQWLSMPGTSEWVAALAHHTYEFPTDAQAAQVSTLGPLFDKPLWMTEICCYDGKGPLVGFGQQYDPTMTSGLWLADTIYQDIAVIGDSQFDWWTALSDQLGCDPVADRTCATDLNSSGWNDGLLYYDPNYRSDGNHSIYPTKRYSVLGNFSRYVRPGAVRHEVTGVPPGLDVLAFKDQRDWSVVVVNNNGQAVAPVRFHIALPTGNGVRCTGAFQTSSTEDLAPVERPRSVSGVGRAVQVPSQSVTTYTFEIA